MGACHCITPLTTCEAGRIRTLHHKPSNFSEAWQGRLLCLGSPGRLKARYGSALALEVQAGAADAQQAALAAWAAAELGAELQVL